MPIMKLIVVFYGHSSQRWLGLSSFDLSQISANFVIPQPVWIRNIWSSRDILCFL